VERLAPTPTPLPKSAGELRADELQAEAQAEAEDLAMRRWERLQNRILENPDYFKGKFLENPSVARAAVAAAPSVPGMALAMVNPAAGATLMTAQEAFPAYTEMRGEGVAPLDAATRTALHAVGTYGLEKLPFDITPKLMKTKLGRILGPVQAAGLTMAMGAASEAGTEVGQEFYQWAVTQGFEGDFDEFVKETDFWEIAASSALMGGGVRAPAFGRASFGAIIEGAGNRVLGNLDRKGAELEAEGEAADRRAAEQFTGPEPDFVELSEAERAEMAAMPPEVMSEAEMERLNVPRRESRMAVVPESGRWAAETPKGEMRLEGEWRIVDASELLSSDQEGFDQSLQPRNRDALGSRAQVDEIARKLNPNRLLDSPTTDDGAPVATADGQVISGNGRVMALREAYRMGTAEGYRQVVADQAEALGVDIDNMQTPVLVRALPEGAENLQAIAEASNRPKILERSAAEQAKADAELLSPELLAGLDPEKPLTLKGNPDFYAGFVAAAKDASLMKADGDVDAAAAQRRVGNAIVASLAAGHPQAREVIRTLTERADDLGLRKQLDALSRSAPALIRTGALKPEYDLRKPFGTAMHGLVDFARQNERLKEQKLPEMSIRDYTGQLDIFAPRDNVADELTLLLMRLEPGELGRTLDRYTELAGKVDTSTGDMFGQANATPLELLQRAAAEVAEGVADRETAFRGSEAEAPAASEVRKPRRKASAKARANMEPDPMDRYLNPFGEGLRQTFGSDAVSRVKDQFVNKPLTNRKTGLQATVSNDTLGKMLSSSARTSSVSTQAHMLALGNVDKLFERANLVLERPDRDNDSTIRKILHFRSTMSLDGKPVGVKLMAKEFAKAEQGRRIYTLSAVEIEDPASWENGDAPGGMSSVLAGSDSTVDTEAENVNTRRGSSTARADVGDITGPGWPGGRVQDAHRVNLPSPPADPEDNPVAQLSRWIGRPVQAGLDQLLGALEAPSDEAAVQTLSTLPENPDIRIDVDPYAVQGQVDMEAPGWREAWEAGAARFQAAVSPSGLLEAVRAISMPVDVYESHREALEPLTRDWDAHVTENGTAVLVRPGHQRLMMEMPELLRFAEWMGEGKIPAVMKRFRNSRWMGVFRHGDGKGERIEIRADIFQLVTPSELSRLREQAAAYAERMVAEEGLPEARANQVADERYRWLVDQAKREARRNNPKLALKVLTHEIAHWVDHMPDHMINERGNILGRLGVFVKFLKQSMNQDPAGPHTISKQDRNHLRSEARKRVRASGMPTTAPGFNQEVNRVFNEMKNIRMRESGIITRADVMEELRDFIAWWRGTETMEEYFEDPAEMYAEAISGYLLNPAELGRRAPITHGLIEAYIDGKPEIKKMWDKLQADIASGQHIEDRDRWLREAFAEGERAKSVRERLSQPETKQKVDAMRMFFDKKYGPIYHRAGKIGADVQAQLKERIAKFRYRGNFMERWAQSVNLMVLRHLTDHNLTWEDLGVYMFHYRVIHEGADTMDRGRSNKANPGANDPSTSSESLRKLRRDLGAERFEKLEETRRRFRGLYEQQVLKPLRELKVLDPELMEYLESNEAYATFLVHRGEQDAIEKAINARYGKTVGTGIMAQHGTFQKIQNPASATMEKGMQLIDMAYRNHAIQGMVEMLEPVHLDEIEEAEYTWDRGRKIPEIADNANRKTVMFLKEGELKAYHVPAALADAWRSSDDSANIVFRAANKFLSRPLKSMYVQWNYGLWPILWIKDIQAYKRYMPSTSKYGDAHYFRHLPRAIRAARSMSRGDPNADALRAMEQGLTISDSNFMGFLNEREAHKRILKRYNQTPAERLKTHEEADGFLKMMWGNLMRGKNSYLRIGQTFERTTKIAGMLYMEENFTQMPEYQRNQIVRQFAGSPDFLESPTGQPILDIMMLFYNPWKLGMQQNWDSADIQLGKAAGELRNKQFGAAFKSAMPRSRWAVQQLKYTVLPIMIMEGIKFGWFTGLLTMLFGGDEEKAKEYEQMARSRSKYNSMFGLDIPLAWADKEYREVFSFRLPFAEGQRVTAMATWNIMQDLGPLVKKQLSGEEVPLRDEAGEPFNFFDQFPELLTLAGTDAPGPTPALNLVNVWTDFYLRGQNPVDSRTNYQVLDYHEARAGGWYAAPKLLKYSWNQTGGSLIGRFDLHDDLESQDESSIEKLLNAPIISTTFGRVIKKSNRGLYDTVKPAADAAARQQSRDYLDLKEAMREGRTPELRNQYDVDTYRRELRKELDIPMTLEERILESFPTKIEREAARERLRDVLD